MQPATGKWEGDFWSLFHPFAWVNERFERNTANNRDLTHSGNLRNFSLSARRFAVGATKGRSKSCC